MSHNTYILFLRAIYLCLSAHSAYGCKKGDVTHTAAYGQQNAFKDISQHLSFSIICENFCFWRDIVISGYNGSSTYWYFDDARHPASFVATTSMLPAAIPRDIHATHSTCFDWLIDIKDIVLTWGLYITLYEMRAHDTHWCRSLGAISIVNTQRIWIVVRLLKKGFIIHYCSRMLLGTASFSKATTLATTGHTIIID